MKAAFLCAAALLFATPVHAEEVPPPPAVAKAEDVSSLDGIMSALYNVISGDAGVKRDWNRFRSFFYPGARMIPIRRTSSGEIVAHEMTPSEYVASGARLEQAGFHEREIGRRVDSFGPLTHVFSTYEAKHNLNGKPETMRGINSIQLVNDGKRWWIVTIAWSGETPDNPIPADYLNKK